MKIKHVFDLIAGTAVSVICTSALPVLLMVGCNILDYITGLFAIPYRDKKLKSEYSMKGIIKKISMWCLVVLGFFLDLVLQHYGLDLKLPYTITCIVATWIIVNEAISILENISDMGVKVPAVLQKVVDLLEKEVL